jgi:hypothetical protein
MNTEPRAADAVSSDLDSEAQDAALAHDSSREAELQRQYDVYAAAKATVARHELREVRKLALRGQYSYHDVRRARREYLRAKAVAPTVWHFGPQTETLKAA